MKIKKLFIVIFFIISFCISPKITFAASNVYCPLCQYRSSDGPIYYKERQFFQKVKILKETYGDSIDTTALTYAVLYRYTGADIAYEKEYDKNFDPNEYKSRSNSLKSAYAVDSSDSLSQSDIDLIVQNEKYDLLSLAALVMVDSNKNGSYSDVCFMDGMSGNRLIGNTSSKSLNPLENFIEDIKNNVINYFTCFNETLRGTDSYVGDNAKVRDATEKLRVSNINNVCKYGYIGGLFNGVKNISNDDEREAQKRVIAQQIIDKANYYRRMYGKEGAGGACTVGLDGNTQLADLRGKSYEERLEILGPIAQAVYSQTGLFASITLAQSIMECGLGTDYEGQPMEENNNILGVKCVSSTEGVRGHECKHGYTAFKNLEDLYLDRDKLYNSEYYPGCREKTTPEDFFNCMIPIYAPASDGNNLSEYTSEVMKAIDDYDLKKWDVKGNVSSSGSCLGTGSVSGWTLRKIAPSNTDKSFTEFEQSNGSSNRGQCVWYAKGRAFEIVNALKEKNTLNDDQVKAIKKLVLSIPGNGGDIYNNAKDKFNTSNDIKKPKAGSFIVWRKKGDYGHVAVVEEVNDKSKTITVIGGYTSTGSCPNDWNCAKIEEKTMTLDEFYKGWGKNYNGGYEFDGYVYFLEPKNVSDMPSITNSPTITNSSNSDEDDEGDSKYGSSKDYVCIDGEAISKSDMIGSNETCAKKNGTTKVLFVGNSRTYVHDIPAKFQSIASSMGYKVDVTKALSGGKTLAQLSDMFPSEISSKYDCVVMQEQTETYLYNYDLFSLGAKSVVDKVKSANKDVKTYVRQTWGRTDSSRAELDNAYSSAERVASETGSFIIPDGKAFEKSASDYPNINLLEDDRHQSNNGAYLSAATIFKKLYGISPKTNYYGGVGKDKAKKLQDVADKVVVGSGSGDHQAIVDAAAQYIGTKYCYAGSKAEPGPGGCGFNCSGLTWYAYEQAGFEIPHTQGYQNAGEDSQSYWVYSKGHWKEDISQCSPGDLVFYGSSWSYTKHVGIYYGNEQVIDSIPGGVQIRPYDYMNFVGCGWPLD